MASPRFLFDEDVTHTLVAALRAQDATIDIVCVGETNGPSKGTLDPELLEIAENEGRMLVSDDRSTMPLHLFDHFGKGRHTHGVALLRKGFALARYVYEIMVIYLASSADEWVDRTTYLP